MVEGKKQNKYPLQRGKKITSQQREGDYREGHKTVAKALIVDLDWASIIFGRGKVG